MSVTLRDITKSGYIPAQHHQSDYAGDLLDERLVEYALRTIQRSGGREAGYLEIDIESPGDVYGMTHWHRDGGKRITGAWNSAHPAIGSNRPVTVTDGKVTVTKSGASGGAGQSQPVLATIVSGPRIENFGGSLCKGPYPDHIAAPIRTRNHAEDDRFVAQPFPIPHRDGLPEWPRLARDHRGVVVGGVEEFSQHQLFMPTDPRIFVPGHEGDPRIGTFFVDLDPLDRGNPARAAHAQSMFRVVRPLPGLVPFHPDCNSLALQLGRGRGSIEGLGLAVDEVPLQSATSIEEVQTTSGTVDTVVLGSSPVLPVPSTTVVAGFGIQAGGPWFVGAHGNVHEIAITKDREPVHSGKIQTNALYEGHGGDYTLEFRNELYEPTRDLPFFVKTYLRRNENAGHQWLGAVLPGQWQWQTESMFQPCIEETPTPVTPIETGRTNKTEIVPVKELTPWFGTDDGHDPYGGANLPIGFHSILGKAVAIPDRDDLSKSNVLTAEQKKRLCEETPISYRIDTFSQSNKGIPLYTEDPKKGRYRGGSACGGFAVMAPERDIADYLAVSLDAVTGIPKLPTRTTSKVTGIYTPGTYVGFGYPKADKDCCGVNVGHRIGSDGAGITLVEKVDKDCVATTVATFGDKFCFDADQDCVGYEEHFPTPLSYNPLKKDAAINTDDRYIVYEGGTIPVPEFQTYSWKFKVPEIKCEDFHPEWQLRIRVQFAQAAAGPTNVVWTPAIRKHTCGGTKVDSVVMNDSGFRVDTASGGDIEDCSDFFIQSTSSEYPGGCDTLYFVLGREADGGLDDSGDLCVVDVLLEWVPKATAGDWT